MSLPQQTLGRTGHSATRLGLGGEGVLRTFGHDRQAQAVIEAALAAGINYFETARAYSGSESYLGRGLKGHRDQIFLTSKSHGRTFKEAMAHLSITLKNLDTDYLDLWQVHDIRTMDEVEALGAPRRGAGGLPPCPGPGLGAVHRRHRPPRPGSPAPGPDALRV